MRKLEAQSLSKAGWPDGGEDDYVITDDFACIADGVTSKSEQLIDGQISGQMASRVIISAVRDFMPDITAIEAVRFLSDRLCEMYRKRGAVDEFAADPKKRAAATVVLFSRHRRELWFVGDCQARYNGATLQRRMKVDVVLANVRALVHALTRENVATFAGDPDPGREFIKPILALLPHLRNSGNAEWGYGAIDGFAVPPRYIIIHPVPRNISELILASDGYPVLCDTLPDTERALYRLLDEDPACIGSLRGTKGVQSRHRSYDDRTYVRLAI